MRKILLSLSVFILVLTTVIGVVMLDGYRIYRFRTTLDRLPQKVMVDTKGLRDLNLSGSNKIVFRDLYRKLEDYPHKKYFINISDYQSKYYGDFTADFFGLDEDNLKFKYIIRRFLIMRKLKYDEKNLLDESSVAEKYGFTYEFIPLEKQGLWQPESVDKFVKTIESIPQDAWIHIFSSGGRGRTTLGMLMVDIIRNASDVSLEDIAKRQHLLGSEDIFDTTLWRNGTYNKEQLKRRKYFIQNFYNYIVQRHKGHRVSWQKWLDENNSL